MWGVKKSAFVLAIATTFVAIMSEMLVHSIEATVETWGMTEIFVGVIVVAIIGNAAEHSAAIMMAMKNKMDIAVTIAIGSSSQVAVLLAPVVVFLSYFIGPTPMDLVFSPLEVLAVILSAILVNFVAMDGEIPLDGRRAASGGLRRPWCSLLFSSPLAVTGEIGRSCRRLMNPPAARMLPTELVRI